MKYVRSLEYIQAGHFTILSTVLSIAVILFSVAAFLWKGPVKGLREPVDIDFYFFYVVGQMWQEGLNVYDVDLIHSRLVQAAGEEWVKASNVEEVTYAYPPQASALFSILSPFSFENAFYFSMLANTGLLIVSLALLLYIFSWYRPIRWVEVALVVSFINTSYGRVNVRSGQLGILMAVLLLGAFILARKRRDVVAGIVLGVAALKPSFLPLYLLYFLLRQNYRLLVVAGTSAALMTLLPLLLTGRSLLDSLQALWVNSVSFSRVGAPNDPSPFNFYSTFLHHLEPLVYRLLNAYLATTHVIALGVVLLMIAITAFWMYWTRHAAEKDGLLDFALVSALSLLAIYHRGYDIFLLFPAFLYFYLQLFKQSSPARRFSLGAFLGGCLLLLILPEDAILRLTYIWPQLAENYFIRLVAPFQAWVGLAVFAALVPFKWSQLKAASHEGVAPEVSVLSNR